MTNIILKIKNHAYEVFRTFRYYVRREKIRDMKLTQKYNIELKRFENANAGKNVYIFGCGPSIKIFNREKGPNDIYVSVNCAIKDSRFEYDYHFRQDMEIEGIDDEIDYRKGQCFKFIGVLPDDVEYGVSKEMMKKMDAIPYVISSKRMGIIKKDIVNRPVADMRGTVFSAIQILLYTNPDSINLVGFDCTAGNSFTDYGSNYKYQFKSWKRIKKFASKEYLTKIVSINPVRLKGIFEDVYTENGEKSR